MNTYTAELYRLPFPSGVGAASGCGGHVREQPGHAHPRPGLGLGGARQLVSDANRIAAARTAGRMRRTDEFTRDLAAYDPGGRLRRGHAATPHRHRH